METLVWPGGAGGSWLQHLIDLLVNDKYIKNDGPHYHHTRGGVHVNSTHNYNQKGFFFNGYCKFNFYLNAAHKFNILDLKLDKEPLQKIILTLGDAASYTIEFKNVIDLDYIWIYSDPKKFISCLFDFLNHSNIKFSPREDVCLAKIEEFKQTCINPKHHFNNFDSIYWMGWCAGVIKHLDIPITDIASVNSKSDFYEIIKNHVGTISEFTEELTYYFEE